MYGCEVLLFIVIFFSISKMHKDWTVGSVPIFAHTDLDLTNDLALKKYKLPKTWVGTHDITHRTRKIKLLLLNSDSDQSI